jgi:tetratricopeptide (TPR) repeat protein
MKAKDNRFGCRFVHNACACEHKGVLTLPPMARPKVIETPGGHVRRYAVFVVLACLSLECAAQTQSNININRSGGPGPRMGQEKKSETPIKPEDRKRALSMMDSVEGSVRGMDGATQALSLQLIAKAYSSTDQKKALSLLDDALAAIRGAQLQFDDERSKKRIRERIVKSIVGAMLPLDESHVEKLLTEVEPDTQRIVLAQLLQNYEDKKEDDKAIDAIQQISRSNEMPYREAAVVMGRMGEEQSAELRSLFTDAMNSYDLHDDPSQVKTDGFPDLIVKFHSKLPPELTRQAIDLVLSHAKKADEKAAEQGNKPSIGIGSSKGAAQFSSIYDFALFKLEPSLREADPQHADQLLKEHREAQLFLAKYPTGMAGLGSSDDPNGPGMMMSMSSGGSSGGGRGGPGAQFGPSPLDMQRMQKIQQDADAHPQDALASVPTLSDPQMQRDAYLGIASTTVKKNSSVARSAISKAMDLTSKLPPEEQVRTANDVANLYRRMDDTEAAKNALEKAMDLADQVFKQDTNADDPNKAPRWYWPSTAAWRSSMEIATKLDPHWANSLLKGIHDDDIRALNQLAIASELLHIAPRMTEIMTFTKDNARVMMMDSREN